MKKPVNEKQPTIQEKQNPNRTIDPGFSLNPFDLPKDLAKELLDKGLEGRFVNIKFMEQSGGYHPKGWVPYKRENAKTDLDFLYGKASDGYVRRGDLVLATKTKEDASKHRAYLDQLTKERNASTLTKKRREEFKDYVKDAGMAEHVRIDNSYEE